MPEKLKILHLFSRVGFAGGGRNTAAFFKFANKEFFDVTVGGFNGIDSRRVESFTKEGTKVEVFHGDLSRLVDYMRRESVDILHLTRAGNEDSQFVKASVISRVPIRIELNVFGMHDPRTEASSIDRYLLQSKTTALRYMSNARLSIDSFLSKCRVQYLPVDIDAFDRLIPSETRRDRIRQNLDIDQDKSILCRVGRPDLWKWSLFVLYSFSLIVERFPNIRFVIVGGAPPLVISKIKKLGLERYFRILSEVADDEATEIVHTCNVMAHSSHIGESFGGAIAEAMAARKPVVVNSTDWADNGQIELVDHGETGIVANTPRQYADGVIYLLKHTDIAERMGTRAYAKAKAEFSARKVTSSLERSYAELADIKKIKPDKGRTLHYTNIQFTPPIGEIRAWPIEYKRRLRKSGYNLDALGRALVRSAWMVSNFSPTLRFAPIPKLFMKHESVLSYLAAVT